MYNFICRLDYIREIVSYFSDLVAAVFDILVIFKIQRILVVLYSQLLAQLLVLRRAHHDIEQNGVGDYTENRRDAEHYHRSAGRILEKRQSGVLVPEPAVI